jgi:hypothetical protein
VAYIAWGKQAHSFSDALLQAHDKQRIAIKAEAGVSGGAAEPEQPAKKQKVADYLDWDEEGGEGGVYMSLEDQLEAEFAGVWSVWMGDIQTGAVGFAVSVSARAEQPVYGRTTQ